MITAFLHGVIAMGMATAGLFFLRFWRESRDRLFFLFALAFFILAFNRMVPLLAGVSDDSLVPYLVRLLAFAIILIAIVDKNIRRV